MNKKVLQNTKSKIFYAAAELFAEQCYADVSVRDIAKKVGIKAASIYNHYSSKEEILDDLLAYYDRELDKIQEHIDRESNNTDTLKSAEAKFKDTVYYFSVEDIHLMGWLIKIVLNEQYRCQKAAEMIYDKSMKQRINAYKTLFKNIDIRNILSERECHLYAELIARAQLTYAMEYVNRLVDHDESNRPSMEETMTFVFDMAMEHIKSHS